MTLPGLRMYLAAINRDGTLTGFSGIVSAAGRSAIESTAQLYSRVGWVHPWIGYLAIERETCVGTCAFTHAPRENVVEIAYHTFPRYEGGGVASRMASSLVALVNEFAPEVVVTAHTLPEENASTRVLRKTGFEFAGPRVHEEDGAIWVWRHQSAIAQPHHPSDPKFSSGKAPSKREPRLG
jgi:ribosomal-protein-alanine N-acetyltransferase